MQVRADGSVEYHCEANACCPDEQDGDSLLPIEADGDDGRGGLPCPEIDEIGQPAVRLSIKIKRMAVCTYYAIQVLKSHV